jgi:DNA-binding CsgD family transcriptional regulator
VDDVENFVARKSATAGFLAYPNTAYGEIAVCNGFCNREGGAVPVSESQLAARLARNIASIREQAENTVISQIRYLLIPLIEHVKKEQSVPRYRQHIAILLKHIEDISSGFATRLQIDNSLSMSELRVALMVKNGLTNEEIAEYLHITSETVKTHRRNIRRKLGITGERSDLNAYLQALAAP